MKLVTYHAEATGVTWYAVRNKTNITPWCMSLLRAIGCWIKEETYSLSDWDRKVTEGSET